MPSDTTDPDGMRADSTDRVDTAEPDRHGDPLVELAWGDTLVGATGDDEPNPEALIEGHRVATAEDME